MSLAEKAQSLAANVATGAQNVVNAIINSAGMPMGMAAMAHVLFGHVLKYNPHNPKWLGRDRFVLSNGHGCALQYIMLHLTGYPNMSLNDLKNFRQVGSNTPGHPESFMTDGVEVTTGPLGQGVANSVGLAMAEAHLAAVFNKPGFPIFDNYVFVTVGDGCLMEGISHEAMSLAGHLGLGKLIVIYDSNKISIDGSTDITYSDDYAKRFEAYGFHVQDVPNAVNDPVATLRALEKAKSIPDKPHFIILHTIIGYGSKNEGTDKVHGQALGAADVKQIKEKFGFDPNASFVVAKQVEDYYRQAVKRGEEAETRWNEMLSQYQQKFPTEYAQLQARINGDFVPKDILSKLPKYDENSKHVATREYSSEVLNALVAAIPAIIGGSADLAGSNKTNLKGQHLFQKGKYDGRQIAFGIREHAMFAACNGIAAYGLLIPFSATFFNFIEYGFPAVRLAALSHLRQLGVMTHDSIGLGEDGPTHQPIEAFALCRATPNLYTLRPADGKETVGSYLYALSKPKSPTMFLLSRQTAPNLKGTSVDGVYKGMYTIYETKEGVADVILIGTGSETHLAEGAGKSIEASQKLNVRVVSAPSLELFDEQPLSYRKSVLLPHIPTISIEAGTTRCWERYSHAQIGVEGFGTSGPLKDVLSVFGFTVEKLAARVTELLHRFDSAVNESAGSYKEGKAPLLVIHYDFPPKPAFHAEKH